jgi:hypothetical protein
MFGDLADCSYANCQRSIPTIGIATGDCHLVPLCQGQHALKELSRQFKTAGSGKDNGNHNGQRSGGHCGQIA